MALTAIPILVGATGTGKTAAALAWAQQTGGHILSADSRQLYQRLAIGTAKPAGRWARHASYAEGRSYLVEGIPHYLTDCLSPEESFSAGDFCRQAKDILNGLADRGTPVMIVGGTGMYLKALTQGLAPLPRAHADVRQKLRDFADAHGRPALHARLQEADPSLAAGIPPNNIQRVVRALEIFEVTGKPLSWWQENATEAPPWPFAWFGLRWRREDLHQRLMERAQKMLADGFVEETRRLLGEGLSPKAPAFQSLGYREVIEHLNGKLSWDDLREKIFRATRLYAKRQMTWFGANPSIRWMPMSASVPPAGTAEAIIQETRAGLKELQ